MDDSPHYEEARALLDLGSHTAPCTSNDEEKVVARNDFPQSTSPDPQRSLPEVETQPSENPRASRPARYIRNLRDLTILLMFLYICAYAIATKSDNSCRVPILGGLHAGITVFFLSRLPGLFIEYRLLRGGRERDVSEAEREILKEVVAFMDIIAGPVVIATFGSTMLQNCV